MSATETAQAGVPTLHHLNNSQSQRILWLLEELGIEYKVSHYARDKGHRAPPEMKEVQELGKSPILVTGDGRAITESTTIATYLIKTYDTGGKLASEDWVKDDMLTSFAGATLGPLAAVELLFDLASNQTPWPAVYIMRGIWKVVKKQFSEAEFKKDLAYLEGELGENEWFNGKNLGKCDIILSYPIDMMAQRKWVDFESEYPRIAAWRKRIEERDAWKRGLEKGNGYSLLFGS